MMLFADSSDPEWDDADSRGTLVSPYNEGHLRTAVDRERTWMMHRILAILTWMR